LIEYFGGIFKIILSAMSVLLDSDAEQC